ncbi:TRAM/LAG1/CLN8 homology domain [Arabidopsis suecica]|uniref:TRAM/LAG1/CLN8 homology domain n=1 Tax=Arabidopsis suecica TaxID=45249 RepID=A0A8T1YL54_ARASU|nr:TRAM/LAG1/CLN8 homology domain [Arabidopsis suecica]
MEIKSYQTQAEEFVEHYLLADPFLPYTSVLAGTFLCKLLFSSIHIKSYSALTKIKRIEWNNRGISTVHAIFISFMALYFVFFSDLFSDQRSLESLTVLRTSPLSNFGLGVSVGYFLADLGMIFWLYPSLGGSEYIFHHCLSGTAVAYSLFSGEAQLYTYMVLISEVTTPEINLRWYLDIAGLKRSKAYLINGVGIFIAWLTARILLFIYMFYHVYIHYDQVVEMHTFGYLLVFVVPIALSVMNLMWFGKIVKGLKKTLEKTL